VRSKIPVYIALFSIILYSAAILYGAYSVYNSINNQRRRAVGELDGIQNFIQSHSSSDFFTEPFREQIQGRLQESQALAAIIITGTQGNVPFEKEDGIVLWDPSPRFAARFGYTTLEAKPLNIPEYRNAYIYSTANLIHYEQLLIILRQTLAIILGAFILSFITMIISLLRARSMTGTAQLDGTAMLDGTADSAIVQDVSSVTEDIWQPEEDSFPDPQFAAEQDITNEAEVYDTGIDSSSDADNFDLPDFDDNAGFDDTSAFADTEQSPEDDFSLGDFLDEDDLSLPEEDGLPTEDGLPEDDDFSFDDAFTATEEDGIFDEPAQSESKSSDSPSGLYSPRSNIGWEAYTKDRLASEIHRCAASEQDLAVLLMECAEGVNCDGDLYKSIATEAVGLFNVRDLSFEYGNNGITVIIPNISLEEGISKAEEFHSKLLKTYPDSFHNKNDFLIGISSRSGRLIDADRLLREVSRALEKAKAEPGSPIIAFKSDPDKYRDYIKRGGS